jgi:pyridoxal phosphate enzyme (YggS family)
LRLRKKAFRSILIEVNVAEEDSKFGVKSEDLVALIEEISNLSSVHVKGLMTVAPYTEKAEENRPFFQKMHQLYVDIKQKNIDNVSMEVLSMGMTGDYEIAIEEGATMIRVGTGIFGERNYSLL